MNLKHTISCPNCSHQFNADELLYRQIEDNLRQTFSAELADKQKQYDQLTTTLNAQRLQLDYEKQTLQTKITQSVEEQVKNEKVRLEQTLRGDIKAHLEAQMSAQMDAMRTELNAQSEKLQEFNKAKADIERLTREKAELKGDIEAQAETKLNQLLREEKQKIESSLELKMRDKEHEIERLKNQIQEAQRVAQQGSMQAQGEVQEIAIEEWLRDQFPFDDIAEIKKGQRGADCIQIVHTRTRQHCGKICYESKRTENFNKEWIEKFKGDLRAENATIGVLVTKTMPKDFERMGLYDGIWVCSFEEFKGLSAVLRESVIQISSLVATQENKGEKKEMLYNFVTSNAFKSQIDAIDETFLQMREDLHKERTYMQRTWAQREKQLEKLSLNTSHNLGAIEGILGNVLTQEENSHLSQTKMVVEASHSLESPQSVKKSAEMKQDSLF
ncbi:MAG: hypothetical protein RL755_726 [Pseudomonadota bacterium]|jgi:hypothetical protein